MMTLDEAIIRCKEITLFSGECLYRNEQIQLASFLEELKRRREEHIVPVVHGHWAFTEYEFFTCSVCGDSYYNGAETTAQAKSYLNSKNYYKYCPNCGAKMDGEVIAKNATTTKDGDNGG